MAAFCASGAGRTEARSGGGGERGDAEQRGGRRGRTGRGGEGREGPAAPRLRRGAGHGERRGAERLRRRLRALRSRRHRGAGRPHGFADRRHRGRQRAGDAGFRGGLQLAHPEQLLPPQPGHLGFPSR